MRGITQPNNGTCFASFGAHPNFQVALERTVTELLQGRSLKDLDVFSPPSFNNDDVAEHANLETHFIDSSGLISWDLFKNTPDYEFVDWDFSGSTQEEYENLMTIFNAEEKRSLYHGLQPFRRLRLSHYRTCMSDIYPADDLIYANNNMGMDWREILLDLPHHHHDAETYEELLAELDEQDIDDATRVREFIGIVAPKASGWTTLRVGELKSMLYLALGELELALDWANWTINMNSSVFTPERVNYYRALISIIELHLDNTRDPQQYRTVFERMYGKEAVQQAWAAVAEKGNPFYNLPASDETLENFKEHQALLGAYAKLQKAKRENWK